VEACPLLVGPGKCAANDQFVDALTAIGKWLVTKDDHRNDPEFSLYIVIDNADELPPGLAETLMGLLSDRAMFHPGDRSAKWCVVLISREPFHASRDPSFSRTNLTQVGSSIECPIYTKEEMGVLVSRDIAARYNRVHPNEIEDHIAHLVVAAYFTSSRDLLELAAMAHYVVDRVTEDNVFSAYPLQAPAHSPASADSPPALVPSPAGSSSTAGNAGSPHPGQEAFRTPVQVTPIRTVPQCTRQWVHSKIHPYVRDASQLLGWAETQPVPDATRQLVDSLNEANRYLVVAMFVCTHNPEAVDAKMVGNGTKQMSGREKRGEANKELPTRHIMWPIERLIGVYSLIRQYPIARAREEVFGQMLSLKDHGFYVKVGSDPPRYRCIASREVAASISASLEIPLSSMLHATKD